MAQESAWTERLARSLRRRLPPPVRRRLGRLRRLGRPAARPTPALTATKVPPSTEPVLSVIIPVFNVEPYLAECLDSVRRQSFDDLEVLVIDDGSTDGSREILDRFVRRDERFRLLEQPNQGQAAARNLAVRQARGEFLTFVDGDDVVPKGAFAAMVTSLRASGSDLVVGAAMRLRNGRLSPPIWNATVHPRNRYGLTIDDFPGALWDVIACNRMFRRTFWVEKVGGFRSGVSYEDHVPMVAGYVRAASFDLLARTTYHWRYRENLSSESQQKHRLDNLRDRIEVKAEAEALLATEASPAVRAAWLGRVLDTDLASYIDFALISDDEYRSTLQGAVRRYRSLADAEALGHVRVLQKIRGHLVAEGRWDDLVAVQTWFRELGGMPATAVLDGHVFVQPVDGPRVLLDLPAAVRELAWHETSLRCALATASWQGSTLDLTGWAFPANVDLTGQQLDLAVRLIGRRSQRVVPIESQSLASREATRWSGQRQAQVDAAGFRVRIDVAALGPKPDTWQLELTVSGCGVERSGPVLDAVAGSSAAAGLLTAGRENLLAVPRFDPEAGFVLETRRVVTELAAVDSEPGDGRLTGRVASVNGRPLPAELVLVQPASKRHVPVDWLTEGDPVTRSFGIDAAELVESGSPARWELRRGSGRSAASGVTWWDQGDPVRVDLDGTRLEWQRSTRGGTQLAVGGPGPAGVGVEVLDDELVLVVDGDDLSADELLTVELVSPTLTVPLRAIDPGPDGTRRWRFPAAVARFGLAPRPLPTGAYQVTFRDRHGLDRVLPAGAALRGRLVQEWLGPHHRIRVGATATALRISLAAPLTDDELGRFAETTLLRQYQDEGATPEDAVLFQSWDGGVAAGDQLALHHALGHLKPGLTRYWAVSDESVVLPDGAVPLILGSRAQLDVLARARFVCSNVDLGPRLRKRPYQRFLQTFDGHPFSATGRRFWEGRRGHPEAWIRAECARLNAQWDVLLAPNRLAAELYRSEYDFTGEILTVGSPRCDPLAADAQTRRTIVRRALGIGDQHTVTLYAPTARDLLTTRGSTKRRFDELDLAEIASHLGPRHHLWVRGHHDNKRVPDRINGIDGIRDLTDYPDVNDLMAAADVLLTDYSAIRFDWAVTGKPMVFFVADEESYFTLRPPLFEFTDSAPGPLARTTDEVAHLLARPADLVRRHGAAIAEFNRRFNQLQDGSAAARVVDAFFYS